MNSMWQVAPAPRPEAGPTRTIRVLLADDHQIIRGSLAKLLQREPDIDVVAQAGDGHEAVALVREHQPDVVVMDITMPRLNGIEATRQVTSEFPSIRIIGLSIHQRADMADAMRGAGAEIYLTKGGPPKDLVAAVRGKPPQTE
ncbi:MAG: response regulator transcription factor [Phycisphaeraceae bacterium]